MKKQILIGLLVMIGMVGIVYGAFSCATTCDATTVSRGDNLVCNATGTWAAGDGTYNMTNGTLDIASAGNTIDSSWVEVKAPQSFTQWTNYTTKGIGLTHNISITQSDVAAISDGTDYQIRIIVKNATGADTSKNPVTCTATTGKTVDRGKPTCALTGISTNEIYYLRDSDTLTLTSSNGTSSAIFYLTSSNSVAMTKGTVAESQTYTYVVQDFPGIWDGIYDDFYGTVTDGTNQTTCAKLTGVTMVKQRSGYQSQQQQQQQAAQQQAVQQPLTKKNGAVIIVLIGLGLYLWFKKKKG